jgi:glycosyltransferase involved in cell wall biosynthesis
MKAFPYTVRSAMRYSAHTLGDFITLLKSRFEQASLSIFHQFAPPPSGGGHQFLRALWHEIEARGLKVENNRISHTTSACLFNSFNFDENRLRRLRRDSVLYVHRVDGPIDVYRGRNEGVDQHICQVNQTFADKTIFQSHYSLKKHLELGLEFKNPQVVINAVNLDIFHAQGREPFSQERKIRIVAASWSDNPQKGASVYAWLDQHLDWERFEFTFIGRSPVQFENIHMIAPVPSDKLAEYLRQHDLYLTASQNDPCSNSLLEALSCGCPALYLKSGGHPEIVKQAGLGFDSAEEIPALLDKLMIGYETYQAQIEVPSIHSVASQYLQILGLSETPCKPS